MFILSYKNDIYENHLTRRGRLKSSAKIILLPSFAYPNSPVTDEDTFACTARVVSGKTS